MRGAPFSSSSSGLPGPTGATGPAGSSSWTVVSKTADYTAAAGEFVRVNATGGAVSITVPTSSGSSAMVYKTDSSSNAVTVLQGSGGQTVIYEQDHCRQTIGNGTTADVVSDRKPYGYADYVTSNTKTGDYTLVKTDAGTRLRYNSASGGTFTIPASSSVAWVDGTSIEFHQVGAGQLTIAHATSSAHLSSYGSAFKSIGPKASFGAIYESTGDIWVLSGNLST